MDDTDFDSMVSEALTNDTVRRAAAEHRLRIKLAAAFEAQRSALGVGTPPDVLAKLAGVSLAQVNMALDKVSGGKLTLKTIVAVADVLGLEIELSVK